jgi:hypothetical protein
MNTTLRHQLTERTSVCILLVLLVVAATTTCLHATPPQSHGLSLAQIEKLLEIHTPDDVLAQEVRSRGLSFSPTAKTLQSLEKLGAGAATIIAVRERIPVATLEIQSSPVSQVTLDGQDRGATDAQGMLVIPDLPIGDHAISIQKSGYKPFESKVTLAPRERKRASAPLVWAGGYLTVKVTPPDATINIAGLGQFKQSLSDFQCQPGTYSISVTRSGMKSDNRSVVVAIGQHLAVDVKLDPDPDFARNQLQHARGLLAGGDKGGARASALALLAVAPENAEARALIAETYWQERDYGHFITTGLEAVQRGGMVTVSLMHEDTAKARNLHPAELSLDSTQLIYEPQAGGQPCSLPKISIPIASLQSVQIQNKSYKLYGGGTFDETFVALNFNSSSSPNIHSIELWGPDTSITKRKIIKGTFVGVAVNADVVAVGRLDRPAYDSLIIMIQGIQSGVKKKP